MLGMLTALGWDGFRNRLAHAYFEHAKYKRYQTSIELDDVVDVIDLERRFDFLFAETNSRVFLLGYFLKSCDIYREVNKLEVKDFIMVPKEVDEFLIRSNVRTDVPDFLILSLWSLMNLLGVETVTSTLKANKGDIFKLHALLDDEQMEKFLKVCTQYGFSINEQDFFVATKV